MYYLNLNGGQAGPFPLEYLRAGWKSGELHADTLYWQEGMAEWQPLSAIRPLLEETSASSALPATGSALIVGGFWRRLAAFLLDVVLLALIGYGSGYFLFSFYMSLGVAGVLVGLVVATAYFGFLSSRAGGGRTLGQRLLGLQVVDPQGASISLSRSILRYLILAFPFFLNKAILDGLFAKNLVVAGIAMVPVLAGFLSLIYLLIFNRGTRQLVHDLITRTYVARTTSPHPAVAPVVWRGHLIVVAVLCLLPVGLAALTPLVMRLPLFRETAAVRQSIFDTGEVQAATVMGGAVFVEKNGQVTSERVLSLLVHLKAPPSSSQAVAARFAGLAIKNDPVIANYDLIDVSVSWGYDIGIASGVVTDRYQHSADQWQTLELRP
jgi:uncharacterized RDD family membrane protein YckC